jgi:hypothetical protein
MCSASCIERSRGTEEAAAVFDRVVETVRAEWHATMRRAGVSDDDCELLLTAFLYDGLFYEAQGSTAISACA